MQARRYLAPPPAYVYAIQPAPGEFTLEVTPTFDAQGGVDAFGETLDVQPSFVLSLRGNEVVRYEEPIQAALPTSIKWDNEKWPLEVGKNEFFIDILTPQRNEDEFGLNIDDDTDAANRVYAVRLLLLRDGAEVSSQTLWSEPGQPVKGKMFIELDAQPDTHHDDAHGI